jgi:adenosylmethionine-8-amino-7-oxononanoate aminotransferase
MGYGVFTHRADSIHDDSLVIRPLGNTIRFCPPLIINAAEVDELLGRFARTLRQVEDHLGPRSAALPVAIPQSRH